MHKCPRCGQEFEGNFCPVCGLRLEQPQEEPQENKSCPKCGTVIKGNANFCPVCGYSYNRVQRDEPREVQTVVTDTPSGAKPVPAMGAEPKSANFGQILSSVGGWFKNVGAWIKSHLKIVIPITVVVIALIILISVLATSLSNKFRVGKVSQIELGYTQALVKEVFGEPYEGTKTDYKWEYYEDKVIDAINKINKNLVQIEKALLNNDKDKFEKYMEEQAKLEEKYKDMTYKYIEVNFSYENDVYKVSSIYFDTKHSANSSDIKKEVKSLDISKINNVNYYIDNTIFENYFVQYGGKLDKISYSAKFKDGSYCKSYVTNSKTETSYSGIKIKWSDNFSEYETSGSANKIGEVSADGSWKTTDTSITNIDLPNSVTIIGYSAFRNCSGLTSITIPDGVTKIGSYAFYGCSGLTSITIPDGVTSIGNSAFYGCSGLTSITIPDGVTSIGSYAFYGCSGLTEIYFKGTKEQWNAIKKGFFWNKNTGYYTIHCTDGDITKE